MELLQTILSIPTNYSAPAHHSPETHNYNNDNCNYKNQSSGHRANNHRDLLLKTAPIPCAGNREGKKKEEGSEGSVGTGKTRT